MTDTVKRYGDYVTQSLAEENATDEPCIGMPLPPRVVVSLSCCGSPPYNRLVKSNVCMCTADCTRADHVQTHADSDLERQSHRIQDYVVDALDGSTDGSSADPEAQSTTLVVAPAAPMTDTVKRYGDYVTQTVNPSFGRNSATDPVSLVSPATVVVLVGAGLAPDPQAARGGRQPPETLEQTIISTVEGGQMTKDLAMLIAPDHEWLRPSARPASSAQRSSGRATRSLGPRCRTAHRRRNSCMPTHNRRAT